MKRFGKDTIGGRKRHNSTTRFANTSIMKIVLPILSLWAMYSGTTNAACIEPSSGLDMANYNFPGFTDTRLPGLGAFGTMIEAAIPLVAEYETPIQMRLIQLVIIGVYNTAASYEPNALDMFGRVDLSDSYRRCSDNVSAQYYADHRLVALAYSYFFQFVEAFGSYDTFAAIATSWNLDLTICDNGGCSDLSTPWGLAFATLEDSKAIMAKDGWNADGGLSNTYNKIPYSDWRANPYTPNLNAPKTWKPLLETNGLGFLYRQEHVTPHIGETAKSFFLGDEDLCCRIAPNPEYKLMTEADLVLDRTAMLDDFLKAEIEFYDSKLTSIVPLQGQYFLRANPGKTLDDWGFIWTDAALISTIYESVIAVWKEKVNHDLIRPTTWIQNNLGSQIVNSYLGNADTGVGPIAADEWQPYIRVMPHAEYPSGSSCLCRAFSNGVIELFGEDDVVATLQGPLAIEWPAGSSNVEANKPDTDLLLTYSSWTEIADVCGRSRLDGGMHFTEAVPAGDDLCGDIGPKIANYFQDLVSGVVPPNALSEVELMADPVESRGCLPSQCN